MKHLLFFIVDAVISYLLGSLIVWIIAPSLGITGITEQFLLSGIFGIFIFLIGVFIRDQLI